MKKLLLLGLIMVCLLAAINPVFAEGKSKKTVESNGEKVIDLTSERNYNPYSKKYIGPVYRMSENGELVKVPFDEYLSAMKESKEIKDELTKKGKTEVLPEYSDMKKNSEVTPQEVNYIYYGYDRREIWNYWSGGEKASQTIWCTSGLQSCTLNYGYSLTKSEMFNIGLTWDQKNVIYANAGFTWQYSASVNSTYSFTMNPGSHGYVAVNPHFSLSKGYLNTYSSMYGYLGSQWVEAFSPFKLSNGMLDGFVYFQFE